LFAVNELIQKGKSVRSMKILHLHLRRLPLNFTTQLHSQSYPTIMILFGKDCHQALLHITTVQVIQQPSLWPARLLPNITIHYYSQDIQQPTIWLAKTAAKYYHTL